MENNILKKLLTGGNQLISEMLNESDIEELLSIRETFRENAFYKSEVHGIDHSEKVMLFAFILCKIAGIKGDMKKIIIDAATYHDIGRNNEKDDNFHGYCSTNIIEKVLNEEFYIKGENLKMLKAAMDFHCSIHSVDWFIGEYEIESTDKFKIIATLVKDADAIDRTRFSNSSKAYLDESYLYHIFSNTIIDFAKKVNAYYSQAKSCTSDNRHLLKNIGPSICFHGVGKDIFKMKSVLEMGILSKIEMAKAGLHGIGNFGGGNGEDWISLIDTRLIDSKTQVFETFVLDSISFLCEVEEAFLPYPLHDKDLAIEHRVPFDNSGYKEEVYAHQRIPLEKIVAMNIPNAFKTKNLQNCEFLFMTLSFDIFCSRIAHFSKNLNINENVFEQILIERKKMNSRLYQIDGYEEYGHLTELLRKEREEIIRLMEVQIKEVNKIIALYMINYYKPKLKSSDISMYDVVIHEFENHGIDFEVENSELFTIIKSDFSKMDFKKMIKEF